MSFTKDRQANHGFCNRLPQANHEEEKSSLFIRPPKLLLVEDNEVIQHVHRLLFTSFGCQVDVVSDGFEAIEKFIEGYDLIILDLELPSKNGRSKYGWDVAKEIRDYERQHHLPPHPIVALSTLDETTVPPACLTAGFDAFYRKPLSFNALPDWLTQWLGHLMPHAPKLKSPLK